MDVKNPKVHRSIPIQRLQFLVIVALILVGTATILSFNNSDRVEEVPSHSLMLGDLAPNFVADTNQGELDFYKWAGQNWVVLFSHPKAFTPVCSTELGVLAIMDDQFQQRKTKILALSVDSPEAQKKWIEDINSLQTKPIRYPLIADRDRSISKAYGMIHPNSDDLFTVRSVFIIDPSKKVRLKMTYPASVGRNYGEILRVLDALQLSDSKNVVTPANWQSGEKVVVPPNVTDNEASKHYSGKIEKVLSYLRFIKL